MSSAGTGHARLASPLGPLTAVAQGNRLVGLYLDGQRHRPGQAAFGQRHDALLPGLREQLAGYFAGELRQFDVPLAAAGTAFQLRVWAALRQVPYASTCSYGELAAAVGQPRAIRAVGAANGRNPICIVVPCHRVVGANGALTGYAGGLPNKRLLLELEQGLQPLVPAG